jgi:phosphatidylglycerophosphate synthase
MSSVSSDQPLSALAASLMENDVSPSPSRMMMQKHSHEHVAESHYGGWWKFLFYFLVVALILYFTFFALRPSFVLDDCHDSRSRSSEDGYGDREINNGKLLGSAIVGALLIIFVFWLFSWAMSATH